MRFILRTGPQGFVKRIMEERFHSENAIDRLRFSLSKAFRCSVRGLNFWSLRSVASRVALSQTTSAKNFQTVKKMNR